MLIQKSPLDVLLLNEEYEVMLKFHGNPLGVISVNFLDIEQSCMPRTRNMWVPKEKKMGHNVY